MYVNERAGNMSTKEELEFETKNAAGLLEAHKQRKKWAKSPSLIILKCIQPMCCFYLDSRFHGWNKPDSPFDDLRLRKTARRSDGIWLGNTNFISALEEINLPSATRARVAQLFVYNNLLETRGFEARQVAENEDEMKKATEGHKDAIQKAIDEHTRLLEDAKTRIEQEKKRLVDKQISAKLDNFKSSPELRYLQLKTPLAETKLEEAQKAYLEAEALYEVAEAFKRMKNKKPFAALAETMVRCADAALVLFGSIALPDELEAIPKLQAASRDADDAEDAFIEEHEGDLLPESKKRKANALPKFTDAAQRLFNEVHDRKKKAHAAYKTAVQNFGSRRRETLGKGVKARHGNAYRMHRLFFRGRTEWMTRRAEFSALDGQTEQKIRPTQLDRAAQTTIGDMNRIFNSYVNLGFIGFLRGLSQVPLASGGPMMPQLNALFDYAKAFSRYVFGVRFDTSSAEPPPRLNDCVAACLLKLRYEQVLLLTALWCKYLLFAQTKRVTEEPTAANLGIWLSGSGYPDNLQDYFPLPDQVGLLNAQEAKVVVDCIRRDLTGRVLNPDQNKRIDSDQVLELARLLVKDKYTLMDHEGKDYAYELADRFIDKMETGKIKASDIKEEKKGSDSPYELAPSKRIQVSVARSSSVSEIKPFVGGDIKDGVVYPDGSVRYTFACPADYYNPVVANEPRPGSIDFNLDLALQSDDYVRDALTPQVAVEDDVDIETFTFEKRERTPYDSLINQLLGEETSENKATPGTQGEVRNIRRQHISLSRQSYSHSFRFNPNKLFWDFYCPEEPLLRFNERLDPQVMRARLAFRTPTFQVTCHMMTQDGRRFVVTNPDIQNTMQRVMWAVFPAEDRKEETQTLREDAVKQSILDKSKPHYVKLNAQEVEATSDVMRLAQKASVFRVDGNKYDWRFHNFEFVSRAWLFRYLQPQYSARLYLPMSWQRWRNEFKVLGLGLSPLANGDDEKILLQEQSEQEEAQESKGIEVLPSEAKQQEAKEEAEAKNRNTYTDRVSIVAELAARSFRKTVQASLSSETPFYLPPMPMQTAVGELLNIINDTELMQEKTRFAAIDNRFEEIRAEQLEQYNIKTRRVADRWHTIQGDVDQKSSTFELADSVARLFSVLTRVDFDAEIALRQNREEKKTTETESAFNFRTQNVRVFIRSAAILHGAVKLLITPITFDNESNRVQGHVDFGLPLREFSRVFLARAQEMAQQFDLELTKPEKDACMWISSNCLVPMLMDRFPERIASNAFTNSVTAMKQEKRNRRLKNVIDGVFSDFSAFMFALWREEIDKNRPFLQIDEDDSVATQAERLDLGLRGIQTTTGAIAQEYLPNDSEGEQKLDSAAVVNSSAQLNAALRDVDPGFVACLHMLLIARDKNGELDLSETVRYRWERRRVRSEDKFEAEYIFSNETRDVIERLERLIHYRSLFDELADENLAYDWQIPDDDEEDKDKQAKLSKALKKITAKLPEPARFCFDMITTDPVSPWVAIARQLYQASERGLNKATPQELTRLSDDGQRIFYCLANWERVFRYLNDVSVPKHNAEWEQETPQNFNAIKDSHEEKVIKAAVADEEAVAKENEEEDEKDAEEVVLADYDGADAATAYAPDMRRTESESRAKTEENFADVFIGRINDGFKDQNKDTTAALFAILEVQYRMQQLFADDKSDGGQDSKTAAEMIQAGTLESMREVIVDAWCRQGEQDILDSRISVRMTALSTLRSLVLRHMQTLQELESKLPKEGQSPVVVSVVVAAEPSGKDEKSAFEEAAAAQRPNEPGHRAGTRAHYPGLFERLDPTKNPDMDPNKDAIAETKEQMDPRPRLDRLLRRLRDDRELFSLSTFIYYLFLVDKLVFDVRFVAANDTYQEARTICVDGVLNDEGEVSDNEILYYQEMKARDVVFIRAEGDTPERVIWKRLTPDMKEGLDNLLAEHGIDVTGDEAEPRDLIANAQTELKDAKKKEKKKRKRSESGAKEAKPKQNKEPRVARNKSETDRLIVRIRKSQAQTQAKAQAQQNPDIVPETPAKVPAKKRVLKRLAQEPEYDSEVGAGSGSGSEVPASGPKPLTGVATSADDFL